MVTKKEASDALKDSNVDLTLLDDFIDGKENPMVHHIDDNGTVTSEEIKTTKKDRKFMKDIQDQLQDLLNM